MLWTDDNGDGNMDDDTEHMDAEHDVVQQGTHTNLGLSDNKISENSETRATAGLQGKGELTLLTRKLMPTPLTARFYGL